MSFAVVEAENGGNQASNATSHTVNLPSGIVAGNLLLVFFSSDGSTVTHTFPAGWTKILAEAGSGQTNSVWSRFADGSEGATITVTTSALEQSSHTSYRLSGAHASTVPEGGGSATGTSTAPDSTSLDPAAWATEDTLWFTVCVLNGSSATAPRITAYPTNYTNGRSDISVGGNGCVQGVARRQLAASSEDPGAFTSDTSVTWRAGTVAVRPAAAAAITVDMWGQATQTPMPHSPNVVSY